MCVCVAVANTPGCVPQFYTKTAADAGSVATIDQQFLTGPLDPTTGQRKLKPDGTPQEPYSEVMDAEVARLQKEITDSIVFRDQEYDKWVRHLPPNAFLVMLTHNRQETAKNAAIGMGVGGVFIFWLWIGSGIETDKAIKAKDEYDRLVALIVKDNQDKADLVKVLELVRALCNHLHALLPKMEAALKAMTELQALFNEQDLNFTVVLDKINDLGTGVDAKALKSRRYWITTAIDEAVEKFEQVTFSPFPCTSYPGDFITANVLFRSGILGESSRTAPSPRLPSSRVVLRSLETREQTVYMRRRVK